MQPKVKKLTSADKELLEQAASLDALCLKEEAWSYASFLAETEKKGGIVLAAVADSGEVAGFLTGFTAYDEAELTNIAVHPSYRRQGAADALIEALISEAGEGTAIFLEVRESNAAAISLYHKHGFEKAGVRKRFYHNPTEDAWIMQRK